MLARIWLVILWALVVAPPLEWASMTAAATGAPAHAAPASGGREEGTGGEAEHEQAAHEEEGPSIMADQESPAAALRASERVELLTGVARVLAIGGTDTPTTGHRNGAVIAPSARRAATWCDVVQCRRLAGAQLLRYATPPPARG